MSEYKDKFIPVEDSGEEPLGPTEKEIAERTMDLKQRLESILWGNEKPSGDIPFSGDSIESFFENVGEGAENSEILEKAPQLIASEDGDNTAYDRILDFFRVSGTKQEVMSAFQRFEDAMYIIRNYEADDETIAMAGLSDIIYNTLTNIPEQRETDGKLENPRSILANRFANEFWYNSNTILMVAEERAAHNGMTLDQFIDEREAESFYRMIKPKIRKYIIEEVRIRNRKKYMTSKYLELAGTCLAFCKKQPQKYQKTINFLERYIDPNEELDEVYHRAAARIFEKYKDAVQKPRLYNRIEDAKEKAQIKVHSGVGNRLAEIANARACIAMKQYSK